MTGFSDFVQKAVFLGIGLASYAGEKAGSTLAEMRANLQKLADEMVARGEITAEEARRYVDEMLARNQASTESSSNAPVDRVSPAQPRTIDILSDDEADAAADRSDSDVAALRQKMQDLQNELDRLKKGG